MGDIYLDSAYNELQVVMSPTWPDVDFALCPYCGATFNSLGELFTHVEAHHLPTGQGYYFCGYCGAEFITLMELFHHWVDNHLDLLTQVPAVEVYLPTQATRGDVVSLTHIFDLAEEPGGYYNVRVRLYKPTSYGGYSLKLPISFIQYVAPDLLELKPECFPDPKGYDTTYPHLVIEARPVDHTGVYTVEGLVLIPDHYMKFELGAGQWVEEEVPPGLYEIWTEAIYYHIKKWGNGCSRSYDSEYVVWRFDTGKKVQVL